ncbi:hypothetical protein PVAP13_7KG249900 [Panicum virgatum]|uniref:Uncharacterized protein n=1 Tax=Panicum virgatum TaxID=38727 RepID=A0A8T0QI30_PANVG|nr:hypothetical protein PVAP13_7KG249900 [Panicum virgatum]
MGASLMNRRTAPKAEEGPLVSIRCTPLHCKLTCVKPTCQRNLIECRLQRVPSSQRRTVDGPLLSQELNLTLYAENERLVAGSSCFSHGRVAVTYGGVAVGEGRVPGWCAGPRSTAEASAAARGAGVRLPEGQRRRLEAELRWGARTSTWRLSCSVTVTRRRGAPSCCGAKLPGLNCRHNRCEQQQVAGVWSCARRPCRRRMRRLDGALWRWARCV